jgi:hypothetical protein
MSEYKFIEVKKSSKPDKKFTAVFKNNKTGRLKNIHFGASGMEDYTIHKDKARMENYIKRHSGMGEDWTNPITAGWWSRWLLWSKPSYTDAYKLVLSKLKKAGYL